MLAYVVCFDITDDKHRLKLAKLLLRYGDRVQLSVFEITLKDEAAFSQLRQRCLKYVEEPDDKLFFYAINQQSREASMTVQGHPIARFPAAVVL